MNWTALTKPEHPDPESRGSANIRMPARCSGGGSGAMFWHVLVCCICMVLLMGCRTARPVEAPVEAYEPGEPEAPLAPALVPEPSVVYPSSAVTNSLQHVTYTFELPHLPERGYIIEESMDGIEWSVLGRSKSKSLRQVTVVDATPNSGKHWRVILP